MCRRFFIPRHRLIHSLLTLQQFTKGVLGEVMTSFSGTAEPQLRLFVIRKHAHAVPPALVQQMSRYGEAGIPELLQHPHLYCFFFLCIFIL